MPNQVAETPKQAAESPKKKSAAPLIIVIVLVVVLLLCGVCAAIAFFSKSLLGDKIRDTVSDNISEGIFENALEESLNDSSGDVDVDVDSDGEQVTWETDEGSGSIGSATEWPDSVPNSVPEFTYARIVSAITSEEGGNRGWSMTFENTQSNAVASYQSDLESAGWTISSTLAMGTLNSVSAEKDGLTLTCSCTTDEDTCLVYIGETE